MSTTADSELAAAVKALARSAGYADCGIAAAEPFADYARALDDRARAYPESRDIYDRCRSRADPRHGAPWVRALVVCVRRYNRYTLSPAIRPLLGHIGRNYLFDRRTPGCPDHGLPNAVTQGLRDMGLRVKRGGVPERAAAQRAGVARIARNGFACSAAHGSWINIESWRVDAELPPDPPSTDCPCPPGCRACFDACPTGALEAPCRMRPDRCVAYLTYSAPEPIAPDLWARMEGWMYGCDRCQEVCPLNARAWTGGEPAAWLEPLAAELTPAAILQADPDTLADRVLPLFGYIPREHIERWQRNARRATATRLTRKKGMLRATILPRDP